MATTYAAAAAADPWAIAEAAFPREGTLEEQLRFLVGYAVLAPSNHNNQPWLFAVDGATRLQAMVRIVIPLALPGILSAGMFAFTLSWNEFLYALIFMNDTAMKTIPVGVTSELIRGDEFFWGQLMAAALLGSVPVALLYSFFVDYFVAGMTAGAVKG